jgi:hypothetical protein
VKGRVFYQKSGQPRRIGTIDARKSDLGKTGPIAPIPLAKLPQRR